MRQAEVVHSRQWCCWRKCCLERSGWLEAVYSDPHELTCGSRRPWWPRQPAAWVEVDMQDSETPVAVVGMLCWGQGARVGQLS